MGDIVEFFSTSGHSKIFYKINSNAVNFEVKAAGNAGIGLSKKIGPECDYLVCIGHNTNRCWIKKVVGRDLRVSKETPNILPQQTFGRFWVSWNTDGIRLGGEGHPNPIIFYNCKANDIKYVTFFMVSDAHITPVHWRVELPPIVKSLPLKQVPNGKLNWVPIEADTLVLPDGAFIGGYEKENLYIIRAKHRGSLTPGKFVPAEGSAYISWGGDTHVKNSYEVLCGFDCKWVATRLDRIPGGAVVAGHSENIEHEKLYVGRARHLNHVIPGKVQPSHRVCYIPYDGKEIGVENYEILVVPERRRANTFIVPNVEVSANSDEDNDNDDDDRDSISNEDNERNFLPAF